MPSLPRTLLQRCSCGGGSHEGECEECKRKKGLLQRAASAYDAGARVAPPVVHDVLRSQGRFLDAGTRTTMESRFAQDFSGVRVHADARAAASADAVHAIAYTVGNDIVFGGGRYAPGSSAGNELLAHELTHVVQQGGASWSGGPIQIGATDTAEERAADRMSRGGASPSPDTAPTEPSFLLQRQGELGGAYLRVGENGRIEVLAGTPRMPVAGSVGLGFRCENGRCQPVAGTNPADVTNRTYTVDEALDILNGGTGVAPRAANCLGDRYIPTFDGCCPEGMSWDALQSACMPTSYTVCLPWQQTPRGTCCPSGEHWDFLTGQCAPRVPPAQPTTTPGPQWSVPPLPQLQTGTAPLRFGTIESTTLDAFGVDSDAVPSQHTASLDHLASLLNIYREAEVHIEGHTDSTAGDARNKRLSGQRAEAVKAELVARGVDAGRLRPVGFGESQLRFVPEQSDADRAGNRRVEIWFYIPPSPPPMSEQLQPPRLR